MHRSISGHRVGGFSLLEVLLVLVIAGLLMGVVATSLTEGPVLRKSAREVAASLRHARSVAILQQNEVIWSMNIQTKQFWVGGQDAKRDLHPTIEAKINTSRSEVVSSQQGNIRFYPDGSSTGGSVELTARNQTFKVNVEWISGRVSTL
ncbi:MAG: GspH/FimT family pseudopilin [Thiolinea sp.]